MLCPIHQVTHYGEQHILKHPQLSFHDQCICHLGSDDDGGDDDGGLGVDTTSMNTRKKKRRIYEYVGPLGLTKFRSTAKDCIKEFEKRKQTPAYKKAAEQQREQQRKSTLERKRIIREIRERERKEEERIEKLRDREKILQERLQQKLTEWYATEGLLFIKVGAPVWYATDDGIKRLAHVEGFPLDLSGVTINVTNFTIDSIAKLEELEEIERKRDTEDTEYTEDTEDTEVTKKIVPFDQARNMLTERTHLYPYIFWDDG